MTTNTLIILSNMFLIRALVHITTAVAIFSINILIVLTNIFKLQNLIKMCESDGETDEQTGSD